LVAAHIQLPGTSVVALASVLGLFKGLINGSAIGSAGESTISLTGIVATVFVVTALAAAAAIAFTWPPVKIAFRVFGSWTAATGLLLLGWSLR
jgi:hydrogenase/urease accessory protein HupE